MALLDFSFRDYQMPVVNALERDGFRRIIVIDPRRSGKDMRALRLCLRQVLSKVCSIAYVFPTFNQARTSLWDGLTIGGNRILDYIPDEICTKNSSEMKIRFANNSMIQFFGSDNYERLRGQNFYGVIFSEYAYQDRRVFDVISPMLAANHGWAMFCSTPYGKNHFFDLYQEALKDPTRWFVSKLTVEDTKHITAEELAFEKQRLSEDMFLQEYYCSFDAGVEGAIYAKYINNMILEHRIGNIPYDPSVRVHTAWDLGVRDSDTTAIIFFQILGTAVHVIDSYENFRQGAEHYVQIIKSKPYIYGYHALPHDVKNFEWGSGLTRIEQLENFGLDILKVDRIKRKIHGIEKVRTTLPRMYIDEKKCEKLIKALNTYHYLWDAAKNRYIDDEPLHDWSSNFCDSVMYACLSLDNLGNDYTADDLYRMEESAIAETISPRSYGHR